MLRKLLPKSTYARNVITLMTGTGIAQAIPIAISPILTRLYSPQEFGMFALYMAVVAVVSVLVTGRYELAILLPRQDRDAIHIAALAAGLSVAVSAVLLVLVALFNQPMARWLGAPELAHWLYWVPASTLLMGIYQSLNYWSNRKAQYRRLAISRTVQSGTGSLAQLGCGYAGAGATGLVSGQITGQALATVVLARLIWREDSQLIQAIDGKRIAALARRHVDFPKFMILGQLANTVSGSMPIFLLTAFFGASIAGFYSLSQRVIVAPMSLIGGAIGDVYRSEAARFYNENGNCIELFGKTFIKLVLISSFISVPIIFFGPPIFALIFGESWREAGEVASILGVMIFFQGISSPMSQTILLAKMQAFDLAWQVLRLLLSVVSLYVGYKIFGSYKISILLFVISFSFLYILHSIFQYYVAKGKLRNV